MPIFKFLLPLVKEFKRLLIIPKAAATYHYKAGIFFIKDGFACNASNEILKTGMVQYSYMYLGLLVVFEKEFGDSSVGTGGKKPELPIIYYAEQF